MPKFAANLSMMYTELPFLDRFAAASSDGFAAVEFLFPYEYEPDVLKSWLVNTQLQQALFNTPPGDWAAGERGLACLPGRESAFRAAIDKTLAYAAALDCPRVHVMAGIVPADVSREAARDTYVANLAWAAAQFAREGRDALIEPINTRDIPGFFLNRQADAHAIVQEIGSPHLKVQMDLYHCQIVEGDVAMKIRQYLPSGRVGHLQIAGVPQRHEPNVGELNYDYLFDVIDEVSAQYGWDGWIGCEYRPRAGTSEGLSWIKARQ